MAKVSKGGIILELYSIQIMGATQKQFKGEIFESITPSNYGATPKKKVLDLAHITKSLTITGYLDKDSVSPADSYAHTTLNRFIKMMDDCGVATLELKDNDWTIAILTWTDDAYLSKYSFSSELDGENIPDKYRIVASFIKAESMI